MATFAPLAPIKARFDEAVSSMSARDRVLLVGLVVAGVVGLLLLVAWTGRAWVRDVESRVSDREGTLALINGLAEDDAKAREEATRIEEELKKHAGEDLPAYVEKTASTVGVSSNLSGVREKEVSTQGNLEEKRYNVDLNKITVGQLPEFLYALETGGYPLRVRSLKTRTVTNAGVKVLNVSLEVSAFRLVEEAATP